MYMTTLLAFEVLLFEKFLFFEFTQKNWTFKGLFGSIERFEHLH